MFSGLKKLLGTITVEEKGDIIIIEGISSFNISNNIYKIWKTSKIFDNMFTYVKSNKIIFNKFFAIDFIYTIERVLNDRIKHVNYRALRKTIDLIKENTWVKNTLIEHSNILDLNNLSEFNVTPLPHQLDFLNIYNKNTPKYNLNGYLLAAAPGSGKTLNSLFLGSAIGADITICIVPKNSVDRVWDATISNHYKTKQKYWTSISNDELKPGKRFYVFHYEQIEKAIEFFSKYKEFNKPFIILDECHNLNDIDSLRTSSFIKLCQIIKCENVLWMSGTPIKALGREVMPLLSTIDPLFDNDARNRFKSIYGKNTDRASDILSNRLGMMTFKIDKKIVVGNIVNTFNIDVKIPNAEKYTLTSIRKDMSDYVTKRIDYYKSNMKSFENLYNECLQIHRKTFRTSKDSIEFDKYNEYIKQIRKYYDPKTMGDIIIFCNKYELQKIIPTLPQHLKNEFKNVRSIIKYYVLKVQGEALGRILGKQRAKCHIDMIDHCNLETIIDESINKTVIFTSFVGVVDKAFDYLSNKGFVPLKVYGDTNKDLPSIINQFDKVEDINPLIATFKSLSTAVPLIMANTVIMVDSPFRQHEYDQALSRCDRIGQTEEVNVYNLLLDTGKEPNISTRSNDIMNWSKEQVEALLGFSVDYDLSTSLESIDPFIAMENLNSDVDDRPIYLKW